MKKYGIVIFLCVLVLVPMGLLIASIKENKAEEAAMDTVPAVNDFESRSSEWGRYYPREYNSYMMTRKSDEIRDMLKEHPAQVILWAGYAFSIDYNAPRGHFYAVEDNINSLRTGAPTDKSSGPSPTACWTCKSPDVPRLMARDSEIGFFTGKWARYGGEVVNPIGCADCHDNKTMALTVTRPQLQRGLDAYGRPKYADATYQDMRSLVCAQCHSEYYFKKTPWDDKGTQKDAMVVTYPWEKGLSAEAMEAYYDEIKFSDYTHALSKTPIVKRQ